MNQGYREVIAAGDEKRRNLFLTTAGRMGTAVQNVEKDFWVCWTLDALFHGLGQRRSAPAVQGRHVVVEGVRTHSSLLRGHRHHGVPSRPRAKQASIEELEALSGKKRRARLDAIKARLPGRSSADPPERFSAVAQPCSGRRPVDDATTLELDPHDPDSQTLLFWYPVGHTDRRLRALGGEDRGGSEVGTRSERPGSTVTPYVADDLPRAGSAGRRHHDGQG